MHPQLDGSHISGEQQNHHVDLEPGYSTLDQQVWLGWVMGQCVRPMPWPSFRASLPLFVTVIFAVNSTFNGGSLQLSLCICPWFMSLYVVSTLTSGIYAENIRLFSIYWNFYQGIWFVEHSRTSSDGGQSSRSSHRIKDLVVGSVTGQTAY